MEYTDPCPFRRKAYGAIKSLFFLKKGSHTDCAFLNFHELHDHNDCPYVCFSLRIVGFHFLKHNVCLALDMCSHFVLKILFLMLMHTVTVYFVIFF